MAGEEQQRTSGEAQVTTYCLYTATSASTKLTPAIAVNDQVCVDCPSGGTCRGQPNRAMRQLLVDAAGNQERIQLTLSPGGCKSCPSGGKTGYTFGSTGGDIY